MGEELALGVDPGNAGGVVIVADASNRPSLVSAVRLYGSRYGTWIARADAAFEELATKVRSRGVELSAVPFWVEEPPHAVRKGALKVDGGPDVPPLARWVGIGRYQGFAISAASRAGFNDPKLVQVRQWTSPLSQLGVRSSKNPADEGAHRIGEAQRIIAESSILAGLPVDVSEAALIAASCLFCGGVPPDRKSKRSGRRGR